jgi:hypothetical protein
MLGKLILLSLLIMSIVIPVRLAKRQPRARQFRTMLKWMTGACVLYMLLIVYVYPRVAG